MARRRFDPKRRAGADPATPAKDRGGAEPRASHVKILSSCEDVACDRVKEFDFPHKRAMLVMRRRERFFAEAPL